jgi:cysteine synthase
VSVTDVRQDSGPDRPRAHEEGTARDIVEQREYSRPQAFFVGPATKLVRGGFSGKYSDGYAGYYTEA